MVEKSKLLDIINLLVLVISIVVPSIFFFQTSPNEVKTQTYIIFGITTLVLIVGIFLTYIISKWKNMNKNIQETKNELEEIKKQLNLNNMFNKMDIRLNVLEKLFNMKSNKRGQIDPRIIWWILLLILLYLFLKSIGFF